MNRTLPLLALLVCAGCYGGKVSLGTCNNDSECAAKVPGSTCENNVCTYACAQICGAAEQCVNAQCVAVAPTVGQPTVPGWTTRSNAAIQVTAVVDGSKVGGVTSAALQISGQPDIAGTTQDTGGIRTYSFTVPGSVQTPGLDTPVAFRIVGTAPKGGVTPDAASGHGQLLIDDKGPFIVNGVVVNGGTTAAGGLQWFKPAATGNIDVFTSIRDTGSGVNRSSLTLTWTNGRLDTGTPSCVTGSAPDISDCHFSVPLNTVGLNSQQKISFAVSGTDAVGNAIVANSAALGIDGQPPTVTFTIGPPFASTTATYPLAGIGCNGNSADSSLYCGHDGNHFWRRGEPASNTILFGVNDDTGSGASTAPHGAQYFFTAKANGTCSSATPCDAAVVNPGLFAIPADFSAAPFSSGSDGTGQVSITVLASDAVGNADVTPHQSANIAVTRVKWMRDTSASVKTFKGAPIVITTPAPQIILGGAKVSSGSIISLKPDGSILWNAGDGEVGPITANMAYSSTTSTLYANSDVLAGAAVNPTDLRAYRIGPAGIATNCGAAQNQVCSQGCTLNANATSNNASGGPAIISDGSVEWALIADDAKHLFAFNFPFGTNGCSSDFANFNGNATTPSVAAGTIYLGFGTTGLAHLTFAGGRFATPTTTSTGPSVFGQLAVAGDVFFVDRNSPQGNAHAYDASLNNVWGPASLGSPANASVIVANGVVFGAPDATDGRLHAFDKNTGAASGSFPFPTSALGAFSAPALGSDGTIYASGGKSLVAILSVGSALATNWSAAYTGTSLGTTPSSLIDSVTTEPTIDASGVMYFATLGGKIYAIITDSGGPLAPTAGSTWPRVGFDNCNSSNTSFNCQ